MLTRRGLLALGAAGGVAVLAGGAGALDAVNEGWLPGRVRLGRVLGECNVDTAPPAVATPVRSGAFPSALRGRQVRWGLAVPDGAAATGLPVAVVLHGYGGTWRSAWTDLGLHHFLAAHVAAGGRPYALASVDGGNGYWHPRASGDDPLGMVVHELVPRLAAMGLATAQIGAMGWSMGGYGALLLARQSARGQAGSARVRVAAVSSPALFASAAATAPGAFDSAADWAAWGDLVAHPGVGRDTALSVSCGDYDAFTATTQAYRAAVSPTPDGGIGRGCHTNGYWRTQAGAQVAFLGEHLTAA